MACMKGSFACCRLANLPPPHLVCSEKFAPGADKLDELKGEQLRIMAGQAADKLGVADGQFTFHSGRAIYDFPGRANVSRVG